MGSGLSNFEGLSSAIHRTLLGILLTFVLLIAIGYARQAFSVGNATSVVVFGLIAGGAGLWITYLFVDGFRER